jgi:hypothetical protein
MKLIRSLLILSYGLILTSYFACDNNPAGIRYGSYSSQLIIVDHNSTNLEKIPPQWINEAKANLQIAYGHTSHGSQITDGMEGLVSFKGNQYSFNSTGEDGAMVFRDSPFSGASDLGNPDRVSWASATRTYLNANRDINVVIWSWCGQVSGADSSDIVTYLELMSTLEQDFPNVRFVYMTGHLDGSGSDGNLNQRNQQIRDFCQMHNKVLYDFADIESYDPDGLVNYMELGATDNCDYDSSGISMNWAQRWQITHVRNVEWFDCSAAHSQPLNGNRKSYAAWWLWARLAGWSGI